MLFLLNSKYSLKYFSPGLIFFCILSQKKKIDNNIFTMSYEIKYNFENVFSAIHPTLSHIALCGIFGILIAL